MDPEALAIILEIVKVLAPIMAALVAYLTLREQNKTRNQLRVIDEERLAPMERQVNGMHEEVVKSAAKAAHSQGIAEGVRAALGVTKPQGNAQ